MHKIDKPIILAICGKSASGKDTLAKFLTKFFNSYNIPTYNMISVTTRPQRKKEEHGKDYYFIDDDQFYYLAESQQLVEFTIFKKWFYGIPKQEIQLDKINIGVFNPRGLMNLQSDHLNYTIIPIYLEEPLKLRLRRAHDREGRWKWEYIRRIIADKKDFRNINKKLKSLNNGKFIYLKNYSGV